MGWKSGMTALCSMSAFMSASKVWKRLERSVTFRRVAVDSFSGTELSLSPMRNSTVPKWRMSPPRTGTAPLIFFRLR